MKPCHLRNHFDALIDGGGAVDWEEVCLWLVVWDRGSKNVETKIRRTRLGGGRPLTTKKAYSKAGPSFRGGGGRYTGETKKRVIKDEKAL